MQIILKDWINKFLPHHISDKFRTLDGSDVAEWLKSEGYTVKSFGPKKYNGLAITIDDIAVSTNGYVSLW